MVSVWISKRNVNDRIKFAQEKLDRIIDRVLSGLVMRESNRELLKGKLSGQIPLSRAASCYKALIESQLKYETLLLSTLWDSSSENRNSIPSVLELVDDAGVKVQLRKNAEEQYLVADPNGNLTDYYNSRRQEEAAAFDTRIGDASNIATAIQLRTEFHNLRNFRNFEIAHSLEAATPVVDRSKIPLAEPFWDQTIECVKCLNGAIRLSDFDFDGSKAMHSLSAVEFWQGLDFKIGA